MSALRKGKRRAKAPSKRAMRRRPTVIIRALPLLSWSLTGFFENAVDFCRALDSLVVDVRALQQGSFETLQTRPLELR